VPEQPDAVAGAKEDDDDTQAQDIQAPGGRPPSHPPLLQAPVQVERKHGESGRDEGLEGRISEFSGDRLRQRLWHHLKRAAADAPRVGAR